MPPLPMPYMMREPFLDRRSTRNGMSRQNKNNLTVPSVNDYQVANEDDFICALRHVSRPKGFHALTSADRLYYLLLVVGKPTPFGVLQMAAQLIGISHRELCMILTDYSDLFYELDTLSHVWVTRCYAEANGYVHDDPSPIIQQVYCTSQTPATNHTSKQSTQPVKNGITCHSLTELKTAALAYSQTLDYRVMRPNDETTLHDFMSRLSKPVRLADLEVIAYDKLGVTAAKSTFRKFLNKHPERYIAPTHGVWCIIELAHKFGYRDWRENKT